jgi:hypothetical protein
LCIIVFVLIVGSYSLFQVKMDEADHNQQERKAACQDSKHLKEAFGNRLVFAAAVYRSTPDGRGFFALKRRPAAGRIFRNDQEHIDQHNRNEQNRQQNSEELYQFNFAMDSHFVILLSWRC